MVDELQIEVPYVPTDENIADFFTKPLVAKKFFPMRDRIMGVPGARLVPSARTSIPPPPVVPSHRRVGTGGR